MLNTQFFGKLTVFIFRLLSDNTLDLFAGYYENYWLTISAQNILQNIFIIY